MKRVVQQLGQFLKRWYKHLLALPLLLILVLLIKLVHFSNTHTLSDDDYRNYFLSNYKFFGVTIPKDINFCGEQVPYNNFHVRQALERELLIHTIDQPQTLIMNKKASRWFPIIVPILKRNGVPEDFKYVAVVESGLSNSTAESTACGFWGLMAPVAASYGLIVNDEVDERFNIEKATDVACKIFKDAYKKYGSWTLAAAAYDMGPGALDKQITKQQTASYYELYLNEETSRYIFRLLAFKEIISRPEAYGYHLRPKDLWSPIPVKVVKVDSSITDLSAFASQQGYSYEELKMLNPWLLKTTLTNPDHNAFLIQFPQKGVKLYGLDLNDSTSRKKDTLLMTPPDSLHPKGRLDTSVNP